MEAVNPNVEAAPAASSEIDRVFEAAAARFTHHREAWIRWSGAMVERYDVVQPALQESDLWVDLLLRAVEADRVAGHSSEPIEMGLTYQHVLSRMWILSAHEVLRSLEETTAGRDDPFLDGVRASFDLVRVPLSRMAQGAGLIEGDGAGLVLSTGDTAKPTGRAGFVAPTIMDPATGSVGWDVLDHRTGKRAILTRQGLSDAMLAML